MTRWLCLFAPLFLVAAYVAADLFVDSYIGPKADSAFTGDTFTGDTFTSYPAEETPPLKLDPLLPSPQLKHDPTGWYWEGSSVGGESARYPTEDDARNALFAAIADCLE
jgi:hypothetical protein